MQQLAEVIRNQGDELRVCERAEHELAPPEGARRGTGQAGHCPGGARRAGEARLASVEKLQASVLDACSGDACQGAAVARFATLDDDIQRAEKERAEYQPARDAFHANQKDAADLENRRQLLAKYQKRLDDLTQGLTARQAELQQLRESYQLDRHDEARREKEALVAEVATRASSWKACCTTGSASNGK